MGAEILVTGLVRLQVVASGAILVVLLLPAPLLAAGVTCAQPVAGHAQTPGSSKLDELEEVIVKPGQSTSRTRDLGAWLKRLEGQYSYEGYVDLCGNGNAGDQRPVTGKADCYGLYIDESAGRFPNSLYCVINVSWPQVQGESGVPMMGGESSLSPAVVVYGVVPDLPGIQFMQIDNQGMTTQAQGKLAGDALTTRGPCGMNGSCQKITRITARPHSKEIAMLVDIEIDSRRVLRHAFLLHRVSNIRTTQDHWGTKSDNFRDRLWFRARVDLESVGER